VGDDFAATDIAVVRPPPGPDPRGHRSPRPQASGSLDREASRRSR
jgi:hypothetical protein